MAKKNWKHKVDHEFRGNHLPVPGQQIDSIYNQKASEWYYSDMQAML